MPAEISDVEMKTCWKENPAAGKTKWDPDPHYKLRIGGV